MKQYIDKFALVAEIERIMNEQQEICKADVVLGKNPDSKNIEVIYQFQQFTKFLDTLEVKEIGVDIDSPEGDYNSKTVQFIDADGNIKEIIFNKVQNGKSALESVKEEKVDNQNCVKPTDKIEPKFHEGEWVVFNGLTLLINEVVQGYYRTISRGSIPNSYDWDIDNIARLWTIQDAKDGDVLSLNGEVFIYAHRKQMYSIAVAHCFVDSAGGFYFDGEFGYTENGNSIHPATKEQRDLIFQKMKEAGYEWNAEKKELRKIEQNPTWSEEDEKRIKKVMHILSLDGRISNKELESILDWLKSFKDRVQSQNFTVTDEELAQAKKDAYNDTLDKIEYHSGEPTFDDGWSAAIWYLKKKNVQPQNTWKPSEGQLECLGYAIEKAEKDWSPLINNRIYLTLKALKKQLEKL